MAKDLKELKALLKLLRSQGVLTYEDGEGVKLTLSEVAPESAKDASGAAIPEEHELTPEELLFYSATNPQVETEQN